MHIAELPLHSGKAPKWLFSRMKTLGGEVVEVIVEEFGTRELVARLSDPLWFQALACALGFDWHSSGTTTVTVGALKEALNEREVGVKVAGLKGNFRKIPAEIENSGEKIGLSSTKIEKLKQTSKHSAKADSIGLLDGFNLYYHAIVFDEKGNWTVIQQGMKGEWARRYHLHNARRFDEEPNSGVASEKKVKPINLTSRSSREARKVVVDLVNDAPKLRGIFTGQTTLDGYYFRLPANHRFSRRVYDIILNAYERSPSRFEELFDTGIGPGTMRALALLSELIYDVKASREDPVKFSFAHGGKDGVPYPVNLREYDRSIAILKEAIENARVGEREKLNAIKRLSASSLIMNENNF